VSINRGTLFGFSAYAFACDQVAEIEKDLATVADGKSAQSLAERMRDRASREWIGVVRNCAWGPFLTTDLKLELLPSRTKKLK
jgi:hypothetical protein